MTLRPIRSSRRSYKNRRARLINRNNWKPWNGWNPYHTFNGRFDPRAGFKIALLLSLSIGGFLAFDYSFGGPFFHNYIFPGSGGFASCSKMDGVMIVSVPCTSSSRDPTTPISKFNAPSGNLAEFNTAGAVSYQTCPAGLDNTVHCVELTATKPPPPLAIQWRQVNIPIRTLFATLTPVTLSSVYKRVSWTPSNATFEFDVTGGHGQTVSWSITTTQTTRVSFYGVQPTVTCVCTSSYTGSVETLVYGPGVTDTFTLVFPGANLNFLGGMAESQNPIGDLSPVVSKELEMQMDWITSNNNTVTNSCANIECSWGWFLTTNSSVWKTNNPTWTPYNDTSTALFVEIHRNAGGGGMSLTQTVYVQTQPGTTLASGDSGGACGNGKDASGTLFSCVGPVTEHLIQSQAIASWIDLNFTGVAGTNSSRVNNQVGKSNACTTAGVSGGPGCSFQVLTDAGSEQNYGSTASFSKLTLPGTTYYLGVWMGASQLGSSFYFCLDQGNICGGQNTYLTQGCTSASFEIDYCIPNPVVTNNTPQATTDSGGFFGSVWHALTSIGSAVVSVTKPIWGPIAGIPGSIFNDLLGALEAAGSYAVNVALPAFESAVTTILNVIGGFLGFPNLGTTLASYLADIVSFFTNVTYGLPAFFLNFPAYFTNFLSWLQIVFPFLTPMFTLASAILNFGVRIIVTGIAIFRTGLYLVFFGYGFLIMFGYIAFVGEDGPAGLLTFLGTAEALSFKLLNIIAVLANYAIDLIVHIISIIPKPLIQASAGKIPRFPTLEAHSRISFPRFDFAELRAGNMVAIWLVLVGMYLDVWFEGQNPSLPGSIGALVPATAAAMQQLATLLPLFQVFVEASGAIMLFYIVMAPLRVLGIDLGEFTPIGVGGGGFREGSGPGGVSIRAGRKHIAGFAQRRIQAARGGGFTAPVAATVPVLESVPVSSQPALPETVATDAEFRVISREEE